MYGREKVVNFQGAYGIDILPLVWALLPQIIVQFRVHFDPGIKAISVVLNCV